MSTETPTPPTILTIEPSAHHPFGPSRWPAFAECADFESPPEPLEDLEVAEALPPEEKEDAKGYGRRMHRSIAMLLTKHAEPFAELKTDEERDQVQWAAAEVFKIMASHGYADHELSVEVRVTKLGTDFAVQWFGTIDVRCAHVLYFDFKFGEVRNYFAQLVGYILPDMEESGATRAFGYLIFPRSKRVVAHIINRETAETVAYGLMRKRLDPHRKPTPCSYCGWCGKKLTCEAFNRPIVALTHRREDWLLKLLSPHVSRINDPIQLGLALWLKRYFIDPWGEALDFAAKSYAENGIIPLGFKRQPKQGSRDISDSKLAFSALVGAGVKPEELLKAASFSMSGVATAYHASKGGTKAAAEREVNEILEKSGAMKRGDASFTLVKLPGGDELLRLAVAQMPLPGEMPAQATLPQGEEAK